MADPILQQIHVDTLYDYRLMLADGRPVLSVIGGGHAQPFTAQEKVAIAAHAVACWNAGAENAALRKQLNAAKIIIAGQDERCIHRAREHGELMQRASDVAGERAANAILTDENAALRAELERLQQFSKDVRYWHSEFDEEHISAESLATYIGMTIGEIDAARKATP